MWKFTHAAKTSKNSTGKSTHRKFAAIHGLVWTFKVEAGFSLTERWTGNETEENNSKKFHFKIWILKDFDLGVRLPLGASDF